MTNHDAVPLMEVRDLRVWFPIKRGILSRATGFVRAVDGVSFDIHTGETLGLVGESGCGKTTLGRTIVRLEEATDGAIRFMGREIHHLPRRDFQPLRRRIQIIFQDPLSSLNPRMNILDIVTEGMAAFGLIKPGDETAAADILNEVGLGRDDLYRYPHEFSGGQRQRINIARAMSLKPEFIVCDEPVSALDVSVQAQVINLMLDLQAKYGLSYLFISHDISVVANVAMRIAVMYLGKIVETGTTREIVHDPLHPYTRALIEAVPAPGRKRDRRIVLSGATPSASSPPAGCAFHPRCPDAVPICREQEPAIHLMEKREIRCHLYRSPGDS